MARARTKEELLEFGEAEYDKLLGTLHEFSKSELSSIKVFDNRTPKDILAHLVAWQLLFLQWYKEGMNGDTPDIPAAGYTWKTAPELNEKLYQDYKDQTYAKTVKLFEQNHKKLMKLIKKHSSEELEEKKRYTWTGSTNLASYLASTTSSHYNWAHSLLNKVKK